MTKVTLLLEIQIMLAEFKLSYDSVWRCDENDILRKFGAEVWVHLFCVIHKSHFEYLEAKVMVCLQDAFNVEEGKLELFLVLLKVVDDDLDTFVVLQLNRISQRCFSV